jgi:DNA-binding MarR family transcriptional regulator
MPQDAAAVYRRYLSAVVLHGQAAAEAVGLNPTDLYALNLLALSGPLTSGELAERTGLTTGATTRLIDRLERGGHVHRRADPADRRKVIVEPAEAPPAGDGIERAVDSARRRVGEVLQSFPPDQLAVLFDYFGRAAEAFLEATRELQESRPAR